MTVRDLITTALLKLGILAEGETATAPMVAGGLRCLNAMLDSWSLEQLLVYTIDRQLFTLTNGVSTYTLGPGGTWNTTPLYGSGTKRPVGIESAYWRDATSALEYPVSVLRTRNDYEGRRAIPQSNPMIDSVWYDATVPLGTAWVYPTPAGASTMILYLVHPWDSGNTLDTVLVLAPGYQRAMEFGLAVELSSEYAGALRPDLVGQAQEAMAAIQRGNVRVPRMTTDLAGVTESSGVGMTTGWAAWLSGRA